MKKTSIKEQRESRKSELKEKYREYSLKKKEEEMKNAENTNIKTDTNVSDSTIINDNTEILDIESKNEAITLFRIVCELKQNKEDKKRGKGPIIINLGVYKDSDMRDRAFEAIKKSIASKHLIKDAGTDNLCFIVTGVNPDFEQFRYKVYKTEHTLHVNILHRNQIRDLFDVEV